MNVLINFLVVIAAGVLFPLWVVAAPTIEPARTEAIVSRSLSPHTNCYSDGEQFQDLADWSNVNATVKAGCDKFATYHGHTFGVGDQVRTAPPPQMMSFLYSIFRNE